jgi:tripartite-type tricarboxylate transporter receptor subunit TctC
MHHLSMEAIKAHFTLEMTHVPFWGTGYSVPALLGGHVGALFSAYSATAGCPDSCRIHSWLRFRIEDRNLCPLGYASRHCRSGFEGHRRDHQQQDTIDRLAALGIEAAGSGPEEPQKVLRDEITRVTAVVKAARIEAAVRQSVT